MVYFPPHSAAQSETLNYFNCSFTFKGQSLNNNLLPGPTLGASLLGVLLGFREHPVAISSDVKGMFHQVHLLEEDKQFLRFALLRFASLCFACCGEMLK